MSAKPGCKGWNLHVMSFASDRCSACGLSGDLVRQQARAARPSPTPATEGTD